MTRWHVQSGAMNEFVHADDATAAFSAAVKQHIDACAESGDTPGPWGEIASMVEVTEEAEERYIQTAPTLQELGVTYKRRKSAR